jgi:hypothetical protein
MENFGFVCTFVAFLAFVILAATSIGNSFTNINLQPEKWVCTDSVVVSPKNVRPVREECTQYTKKTGHELN